jgi:hypothetical protein
MIIVGCYLYLVPGDGNVHDIWETKSCEMMKMPFFAITILGQKCRV